MRGLLFEIGCEELPASAIRPTLGQLQQAVTAKLAESGVGHGEAQTYSTPRRIGIWVADVEPRQPDATVEARGPGLSAAFDPEGNPTKALEGFCRGQGVSPDQVEKRDGYVWANRNVPGRLTVELLQELLPNVVHGLAFSKTMRWGSHKMRFVRPIRWLLACLDGQIVDFEIDGVRTGNLTYGHRFVDPGPFAATDIDGLFSVLRKAGVEPDMDKRTEMVLAAAGLVTDGKVDMNAELVEENVHLTEWPQGLVATFPEEFLALPDPVLATVMAKHERFFPVRGADGRMEARFVSIRNGGEEGSVREGNEWVLKARFNDALFFFEDDKKRSLPDFLESTAGMNFHESLGTVRQRADRISALAGVVANLFGCTEGDSELARQAGLLAKADLGTGLVSELDELQGLIGEEYARREGMSPSVCRAIGAQYDLAKASSLAGSELQVALCLFISDQTDKLAGFLGRGIVPSGSSDPYGLRRAATQLIEACWAWPHSSLGLEPVFDAALAGYAGQGLELDVQAAHDALRGIMASRYESLFEGVRHDVVAAASKAPLEPRKVRLRVACLEASLADVPFLRQATRPLNLVNSCRTKSLDWSQPHGILDSAEGDALAASLARQAPIAQHAFQAESAEALVAALKPLGGPIDAFFESTMVMVDDLPTRNVRLALLEQVADLLALAGDFSAVVIEG